MLVPIGTLSARWKERERGYKVKTGELSCTCHRETIPANRVASRFTNVISLATYLEIDVHTFVNFPTTRRKSRVVYIREEKRTMHHVRTDVRFRPRIAEDRDRLTGGRDNVFFVSCSSTNIWKWAFLDLFYAEAGHHWRWYHVACFDIILLGDFIFRDALNVNSKMSLRLYPRFYLAARLLVAENNRKQPKIVRNIVAISRDRRLFRASVSFFFFLYTRCERLPGTELCILRFAAFSFLHLCVRYTNVVCDSNTWQPVFRLNEMHRFKLGLALASLTRRTKNSAGRLDNLSKL